MGYALFTMFLFIIWKLIVTFKVPSGLAIHMVGAKYELIEGSINSDFPSLSNFSSMAFLPAGVFLGV